MIEYIESELTAILAEDADLAALVGPRVYPMVLPQNPTLPAIVYQELRSDARAMADGDSGERESRFQLSYWAGSFSAIKVGKRLLVDLLSGYSGSGVERIDVGAMRDDYEPQTGWYRQIVEIEILWSEGE